MKEEFQFSQESWSANHFKIPAKNNTHFKINNLKQLQESPLGLKILILYTMWTQ